MNSLDEYNVIKRMTLISISNLKIHIDKIDIPAPLKGKVFTAIEDLESSIQIPNVNISSFDNIEQHLEYRKNILSLANTIIRNFHSQLSYAFKPQSFKPDTVIYSLNRAEEIKHPINSVFIKNGHIQTTYPIIYETIDALKRVIHSSIEADKAIYDLLGKKEVLARDRGLFSNEITRKDKLIEKLTQEKDQLTQEKDQLTQEKDQLTQEKDQLIEEKEKLQTKVLSSENMPIMRVYKKASTKYSKLHENFRKKFYCSIVGIIITLFLMIFFKKNMYPDLIEFWILKVSLMLIGVTLASYFLKQSSHYQRLADQHHQTTVELEAYPNFMNSVPLEEAVEIRKELALKYFGKAIDSSPHKDMSNLISDQMKSTTDMVKATTDAIKNLNTK